MAFSSGTPQSWNFSIIQSPLVSLHTYPEAATAAFSKSRFQALLYKDATSTLAGILTLLGSVANLIVAEVASRRGVKLFFWEYTKPGFIIILISLLLGVAWIQLFIWR